MLGKVSEYPSGRDSPAESPLAQTPLTLDGLDEIDLIGRSLRRKGLKVMLGVPLMAGGQVIGVVHVGRRSCATVRRP